MFDEREIVATFVKILHKSLQRRLKVSSEKHMRGKGSVRLNGIARLVYKG